MADAVVRTFDEFIQAAADCLGDGSASNDSAAFISGETLDTALRRWWGEVLGLDVIDDHRFSWTCTGCGTQVESSAPVYELEMFDHLLWDLCESCKGPSAAAEGTPD